MVAASDEERIAEYIEKHGVTMLPSAGDMKRVHDALYANESLEDKVVRMYRDEGFGIHTLRFVAGSEVDARRILSERGVKIRSQRDNQELMKRRDAEIKHNKFVGVAVKRMWGEGWAVHDIARKVGKSPGQVKGMLGLGDDGSDEGRTT